MVNAERAYLKIEASRHSFFINAKKQDAEALESLFPRYGISCERKLNVRPGEDTLDFFYAGERSQAELVLHAYKTTQTA